MKIIDTIKKLNEIQDYIISGKTQSALNEINNLKGEIQSQKDDAGDYMEELIKKLK